MHSAPRRVPSGFTLIELLIVISIIGVLAALITVVAYRALVSTQEFAIKAEITDIVQAVEKHQLKQGTYPVDFSDPVTFDAYMKRAYPRHREDVAGWLGSVNLDASEALVFFLGGGLKKNSEFPLTGPGEPDIDFEFKEERLVDLDGDGFPSYVPQYGKGVPFVYFDARTYALVSFSGVGSGVAHPYFSDNPDPNNAGQVLWVNPKKFQILSAGLDADYGADVVTKQFPSGAGYLRTDRDNIADFSSVTFEDHLP